MKHLPKIKVNQDQVDIGKAAVKGATKGGLAGGALAVITGAAVVATAPAWIPIIGGTAAVSVATVAAWGGIGAAVGAATNGAVQFRKAKRRNEEFDNIFGKK